MGNEKREWNNAFLVSQPCSNVTSAQKVRYINFEPRVRVPSGSVARAPVLARVRRYLPEDEQGAPMGEAGGSGSASFDGIRHGCFYEMGQNPEE